MMTKPRLAAVFLAGALVWGTAGLVGAQTYDGPRTTDGRPDLSGIWQVLGSAAWDLEAHNAQDGIPAGLSVVEGGTIPYTPSAAAQRDTNRANRLTDDPVRKCFLPGVPRVTYMPWPFRIVQTPDHVVLSYEYAHTVRIIYTDGSPHPLPNDFWMGDSRGHWEGDTLVVETTHFQGMSGYRQSSDALRVTERFTRVGPETLHHEVTFDDPKTWTAPWTIVMPLEHSAEPIFEYACHEGNIGMEGILAGHRAEERAAEGQ